MYLRYTRSLPAEPSANNVVGHLLDGVTGPVLLRAVEYWRNVDKHLRDRIEAGERARQNGSA